MQIPINLPQPVILWTDALLFVLIITVITFTILAKQHPHLATPWRYVFRNRLGMGTAIFLSLYLLIALMDSIHFRPQLPKTDANIANNYSTEVLSLLDIIITPLRIQHEKTYSAPLSAYLYTKETIKTENGVAQRIYPRLIYGGAHLTNPEKELIPDILIKASYGLLSGFVLWLSISIVILYWLAIKHSLSLSQQVRQVLTDTTILPWRTIILITGFLILIIGITTTLAGYYHIFGTDKVGEDVLDQTIKSIRTGLIIGTLTTLIMLPAAIIFGLMAGYFRGIIDDIIQYLYTTLSSIPGVLLIAASILMLQVYMNQHADNFTSLVERADLRLVFLCLILGVTSWTGLCRLLRGETLKLRELDYIQASLALGSSHFAVLYQHVLPNVLHLVLIRVALDFSDLVLAEAVLSYVNIGVDPTTNSWGNMINGARLELAREPVVWWSLAASFSFMFILVLAANLFADVVRDAFDPRLR